ncbi:MAG TPA: TonB family protein [Thermoanaerobaculia bacterium]|jgi:TonB family protein|nr:TonB family protein [Thermoanaerobaculia bacterium]
MPHFFISYRRSDQEGKYLAHMIFRELRRRYGEESTFLDVDSRSPGLSFPVKVDRALRVTDIVLVIIGPAWLQLLTERLEDPRDWVRYEVAESLKRSWLPVVPVCLAGVEMPRPQQLPEELKDLGWRDGATLDPFQDFDSHLSRLLSDLENVLKTTLREKEELRAARWELTALLRWRAHQLELAAAREAASKLAAERTVKERIAAEERARWAAAAEAAELATQVAAKAKAVAAEREAAQAARVQKKAEPEPQRAREAPASRWGPNPLPAAPSGPTSVPPRSSVAPPWPTASPPSFTLGAPTASPRASLRWWGVILALVAMIAVPLLINLEVGSKRASPLAEQPSPEQPSFKQKSPKQPLGKKATDLPAMHKAGGSADRISEPTAVDTGMTGGGGGVVEDAPLRVSGGVTRPEIINKVEPVYTELARRARVTGTVIVEAIIDTGGNVTNVRVLKGLPMGLDGSAVEAVQEWKFRPATLEGKPVKVYYVLTVNFQVQ